MGPSSIQTYPMTAPKPKDRKAPFEIAAKRLEIDHKYMDGVHNDLILNPK